MLCPFAQGLQSPSEAQMPHNCFGEEWVVGLSDVKREAEKDKMTEDTRSPTPDIVGCLAPSRRPNV